MDDDTKKVAVKLAIHQEKIDTHEACLRRVQTKVAKTDSEIKMLVKEMSKHMLKVQQQSADMGTNLSNRIDKKVAEMSTQMEARFKTQFTNARNWIAIMIDNDPGTQL